MYLNIFSPKMSPCTYPSLPRKQLNFTNVSTPDGMYLTVLVDAWSEFLEPKPFWDIRRIRRPTLRSIYTSQIEASTSSPRAEGI